MEIKYHRKFIKELDKLNYLERDKIDKTISIFTQNPFDYRLRNHALNGFMSDRRSIWVDFKTRIIFREFENYTLVIFLEFGGHGQVY